MTNREEFERVDALLDKAVEEKQHSKISGLQDRRVKLKLLVAIEKKLKEELPLLQFHVPWIDYVRSLGFKGKPNKYQELVDFLEKKNRARDMDDWDTPVQAPDDRAW